MKIIALFFFLFTPVYLWSQAVTEKNQSVSADILGIKYNYELPLNDKFTVNLYGGLKGEIGYFAFKIGNWQEEYWLYSIRGEAGADFRYYYNLAKRSMKGKNTRKNTSNFWAINVSYLTPPAISSPKWILPSSILMASPYWGIRRVYKSNLFFELHLGLSVGVHQGKVGFAELSNIKFGYVF